MPLNPAVREYLARQEEAQIPSIEKLSPAEARYYSRLRSQAAVLPDVVSRDILVSGRDGLLTARIYEPDGDGPFPILVWFHGGGWVVGDLYGTDIQAKAISEQTGCIVASIDYRLAPETKFPGPVEDCYSATEWVYRNALELNGNPNKIAVGGSSAGGNLAAAVSLMARDRNASYIKFQLLVYPVTDRNLDTKSYIDNSHGYSLTRDAMRWYWDHYLDSDSDALNPYAAPLQSCDLTGLPDALIVAAEYDPLRTEAEKYAEAMASANVRVEYKCYDGLIHGFFGLANEIPAARVASSNTCESLIEAFKGK